MTKNENLTPERISFFADNASFQIFNEDEKMIFSGNLKDYADFIGFCTRQDKQNSRKGLRFLLDNQERFNLNCEYDNDAETVYIQLSDKKTGQETVFDGADIFRQIYEWSEKNIE